MNKEQRKVVSLVPRRGQLGGGLSDVLSGPDPVLSLFFQDLAFGQAQKIFGLRTNPIRCRLHNESALFIRPLSAAAESSLSVRTPFRGQSPNNRVRRGERP